MAVDLVLVSVILQIFPGNLQVIDLDWLRGNYYEMFNDNKLIKRIQCTPFCVKNHLWKCM